MSRERIEKTTYLPIEESIREQRLALLKTLTTSTIFDAQTRKIFADAENHPDSRLEIQTTDPAFINLIKEILNNLLALEQSIYNAIKPAIEGYSALNHENLIDSDWSALAFAGFKLYQRGGIWSALQLDEDTDLLSYYAGEVMQLLSMAEMYNGILSPELQMIRQLMQDNVNTLLQQLGNLNNTKNKTKITEAPDNFSFQIPEIPELQKIPEQLQSARLTLNESIANEKDLATRVLQTRVGEILEHMQIIISHINLIQHGQSQKNAGLIINGLTIARHLYSLSQLLSQLQNQPDWQNAQIKRIIHDILQLAGTVLYQGKAWLDSLEGRLGIAEGQLQSQLAAFETAYQETCTSLKIDKLHPEPFILQARTTTLIQAEQQRIQKTAINESLEKTVLHREISIYALVKLRQKMIQLNNPDLINELEKLNLLLADKTGLRALDNTIRRHEIMILGLITKNASDVEALAVLADLQDQRNQLCAMIETSSQDEYAKQDYCWHEGKGIVYEPTTLHHSDNDLNQLQKKLIASGAKSVATAEAQCRRHLDRLQKAESQLSDAHAFTTSYLAYRETNNIIRQKENLDQNINNTENSLASCEQQLRQIEQTEISQKAQLHILQTLQNQTTPFTQSEIDQLSKEIASQFPIDSSIQPLPFYLEQHNLWISGHNGLFSYLLTENESELHKNLRLLSAKNDWNTEAGPELADELKREKASLGRNIASLQQSLTTLRQQAEPLNASLQSSNDPVFKKQFTAPVSRQATEKKPLPDTPVPEVEQDRISMTRKKLLLTRHGALAFQLQSMQNRLLAECKPWLDPAVVTRMETEDHLPDGTWRIRPDDPVLFTQLKSILNALQKFQKIIIDINIILVSRFDYRYFDPKDKAMIARDLLLKEFPLLLQDIHEMQIAIRELGWQMHDMQQSIGLQDASQMAMFQHLQQHIHGGILLCQEQVDNSLAPLLPQALTEGLQTAFIYAQQIISPQPPQSEQVQNITKAKAETTNDQSNISSYKKLIEKIGSMKNLKKGIESMEKQLAMINADLHQLVIRMAALLIAAPAELGLSKTDTIDKLDTLLHQYASLRTSCGMTNIGYPWRSEIQQALTELQLERTAARTLEEKNLLDIQITINQDTSFSEYNWEKLIELHNHLLSLPPAQTSDVLWSLNELIQLRTGMNILLKEIDMAQHRLDVLYHQLHDPADRHDATRKEISELEDNLAEITDLKNQLQHNIDHGVMSRVEYDDNREGRKLRLTEGMLYSPQGWQTGRKDIYALTNNVVRQRLAQLQHTKARADTNFTDLAHLKIEKIRYQMDSVLNIFEDQLTLTNTLSAIHPEFAVINKLLKNEQENFRQLARLAKSATNPDDVWILPHMRALMEASLLPQGKTNDIVAEKLMTLIKLLLSMLPPSRHADDYQKILKEDLPADEMLAKLNKVAKSQNSRNGRWFRAHKNSVTCDDMIIHIHHAFQESITNIAKPVTQSKDASVENSPDQSKSPGRGSTGV